MRTTVNIHDGLLKTAKEVARREGKTLGDVIEAALQNHLVAAEIGDVAPPLPVFEGGTGVAPDIDPTSNVSLYDAMYEEEDAAMRALIR